MNFPKYQKKAVFSPNRLIYHETPSGSAEYAEDQHESEQPELDSVEQAISEPSAEIEIEIEEAESRLDEYSQFIKDNPDVPIGEDIGVILDQVDFRTLNRLASESANQNILSIIAKYSDFTFLTRLLSNPNVNSETKLLIFENPNANRRTYEALSRDEDPEISSRAFSILEEFRERERPHPLLLRNDDNDPRGITERLLEDSALTYMEQINDTWITNYVDDLNEIELANYKAVIARNLYFRSIEVSEESCQSELRRLQELRETYGDVEIFNNRNILYVAHMETWLQDEYRFGQETTLDAIANQGGNINLLRSDNSEQETLEVLKERTLRLISETPPPFTFVFDGHGFSEGLGLAQMEADSIDAILENTYLYLSVDELSSAILQRYELFPQLLEAEPNERDIFIFSSCFSYNFIRNLYQNLANHQVTLPIALSPSEYGQYSIADPTSDFGIDFLETTLQLENAGHTTTIGDTIDFDSQQESTNPSLFIPDGTTPIQVSENQINSQDRPREA